MTNVAARTHAHTRAHTRTHAHPPQQLARNADGSRRNDRTSVDWRHDCGVGAVDDCLLHVGLQRAAHRRALHRHRERGGGQQFVAALGQVLQVCSSPQASFAISTGLFCHINRSLLPYQYVSFAISIGLFCHIHRSLLPYQ